MGDHKREWGVFDPGNVGAYPGRVETVLPGALDETILDVRGTDDRGVTLTTVCLSAMPFNPTIDTLRTAFARIAWGVGGGRDEVMIDYLHGQAITIPASYIRTTATYPVGNVNPPGWPPVTPEPETFGIARLPTDDPVLAKQQALILGANIAPQPHPIAAHGSTPRLTIYVDVPAGSQQAPAGSEFIRVPPHAQSVTVLTNADVFDPILISAHSLQTGTSSLYSQSPTTNNDANGAFPIARGVEYVRVWNDTEQNGLVLLIWTIGL